MTTVIDIESTDTTLEVQKHFLKGIVVTIWVGNMEPHSSSLDEDEAVEFARGLLTPYITDGRSNVILTDSSVMAIRNSDETAWATVDGAHMLLAKKQVLQFAAALINAAAA